MTGAVAHGSQTGAGGGQAGAATATGAGLGKHQLQQPQPAALTANKKSATRTKILFIERVSLPGDIHRVFYGGRRAPVRCCHCSQVCAKNRPLNHTRLAMMCNRDGCESATILGADIRVATNMPRAPIALAISLSRVACECLRAHRNFANHQSPSDASPSTLFWRWFQHFGKRSLDPSRRIYRGERVPAG